jgi:class 3 adenylate cyclase
VRIGLGAGEPLTDGQGLFGSTVNLTFRICNAAAPGQILAARVVRELASGRTFTFERHGEVALNGFPEPVELHEVVWAE